PVGRSRKDDPDTSRLAGESISAFTDRAIIAVYHEDSEKTCRGLTDDELCAELPDLHAPTVKTARSRLTDRGLLVDIGWRRLSNRGRQMIVWHIAPRVDVDVQGGRL